MRKLIALLTGFVVIAVGANASDPPKGGAPTVETAVKPASSAHASAGSAHGASAASAASGPKLPYEATLPIPGGSARAKSSAKSEESEKAKDDKPRGLDVKKVDETEADLTAKIAQRLAILRANQAARAAAAEKARKAAAAKEAAAVAEKAKQPPPKIEHWTYEGETGPANWGKINTDWAKCSAGNRQSPIDIRDGMKVDLEQIVFDYRPTSFSVIDNGHTVQVTLAGGNYLTVGNRMYELLQFHFHRPSEERINGKGFEMVVHMVHRDAEGKLAVLAVLLERGNASPIIQTVWNNLPLEKNMEVSPAVLIDPTQFLPQRREYFTYMGSLTTPPCTEGVLWLVMKQPMSAAPAQMALFSRLYPLNARPIQPNAGRVIKESN
ncbi:carbonic anhydrase [Massilia sp. TS11]|uniref:carbonic anhydrase n=1 Tax=Massilia sp. TS11 TaxID=2908003 RepID=UPI001EDB3B40|nr:carbonic anhydrase family protein [Massilia sp. TS11]MCG2583528.1 carbonic anhydrase family protein [Massilia sp. TS11]